MEEEKTREFPEPEGSGTKQYLEEMQRIFAVREATYQKRKKEYDQKSRDLQKIQTELGRQYQWEQQTWMVSRISRMESRKNYRSIKSRKGAKQR